MKTENTHIKGCSFSSTAYDKFRENGRQNIFEEVIDNLIAEGLDIPSDFIEDLPVEEKREFILNCLIPEEGPTINEMFKNIKNSETRSQHLKNSIETIKEFIKVGKQEIKKYGEVYTPITLVQEMLDTLPKDVWSNPDLKWLDPANGMGNFPLVVIVRLMKGLKEWEPDREKRYKHIIENMVYVSELQPRNCFIYLSLVDPNDEYDVNLYCGSFLDDPFNEHMKDVWELDKFDIIVGNPPYNGHQIAKGKRGGGTTLWDKFVIKSINTLKENGFLNMVHPTLWRKPQSKRSSSRKVSEVMKTKQIHFLKMHNSEDGMRIFKAGTRFDFYLLENSEIYKNTDIIDEEGEKVNIDLKDLDFIPNSEINFIEKIIAKGCDSKCPIIFNRTNYGTDKSWVIDIKDCEFKYPLVHSTPKSGNRWMYSSRNDKGHFGVPKVIFGESGIYDVIIDVEGKYGMTQGSMAIEIRNGEYKLISEALKSDKFKIFLKSASWSNFRIDWRLFTYLKEDFWYYFINI